MQQHRPDPDEAVVLSVRRADAWADSAHASMPDALLAWAEIGGRHGAGLVRIPGEPIPSAVASGVPGALLMTEAAVFEHHPECRIVSVRIPGGKHLCVAPADHMDDRAVRALVAGAILSASAGPAACGGKPACDLRTPLVELVRPIVPRLDARMGLALSMRFPAPGTSSEGHMADIAARLDATTDEASRLLQAGMDIFDRETGAIAALRARLGRMARDVPFPVRGLRAEPWARGLPRRVFDALLGELAGLHVVNVPGRGELVMPVKAAAWREAWRGIGDALRVAPPGATVHGTVEGYLKDRLSPPERAPMRKLLRALLDGYGLAAAGKPLGASAKGTAPLLPGGSPSPARSRARPKAEKPGAPVLPEAEGMPATPAMDPVDARHASPDLPGPSMPPGATPTGRTRRSPGRKGYPEERRRPTRAGRIFEWTPEREEALRRMWEADATNTEIARRLGHGLTKNAVAGKVHRLGLGAAGQGGAS